MRLQCQPKTKPHPMAATNSHCRSTNALNRATRQTMTDATTAKMVLRTQIEKTSAMLLALVSKDAHKG